jgi:hypothetical protein
MATAKKTTAKKTTTKKVVKPVAKSFKVHKETEPFMTFKVTEQTVYWLIFLAAVLILGIWLVNSQNNVASILDGIQ